MKKRVSIVVLIVLIAMLCTTALVACDGDGTGGGSSSTAISGTYYLYESDELDKSVYIKIDEKTWTDENGISGEYTVSSNNITLYTDVLGEKAEFATGTVKDGVLILNILGEQIIYCKEGKKPSTGGGEYPNEKFTLTFDANGGAFSNGTTTIVQNDILSGSLLTAPASPIKDGYTFAGWSKGKNGNDLWKFDSDRLTKNTTLYAVWKQKSGVIISVDGASISGTDVLMIVDRDVDSVHFYLK